MSKAQLAVIGLLGALNAALVISGITYCCVPKSKNTAEKNTENLNELKIAPKSLESENYINKNQKKEVIKNDTSEILIAPPPKGISNVTDIYIKDGRKIELCQQQKLDCWGYAAIFVACLKGKGTKVTLEEGPFKELVDSRLKTDRGSFQDISASVQILENLGVKWKITHKKVSKANEMSAILDSILNDNKVAILTLKGHFITVCGKIGDKFQIYDSLYGKVISMEKNEIFTRLPKDKNQYLMQMIMS